MDVFTRAMAHALARAARDHHMEQVGWDGKERPQSLRRPVQAEWSEALEPLSDPYVDQVFQGH